jgi:hypothetical protein
VHYPVTGPLGKLDRSSRVADAGRGALSYRERRLGKRRAV